MSINAEDYKAKVDSPAHYANHPSGVQPIVFARKMNFNCGSAFKYVWRYEHKVEPVVDLSKAMWFLADEYKHGTTGWRFIDQALAQRFSVINNGFPYHKAAALRHIFEAAFTGEKQHLLDAEQHIRTLIEEWEAFHVSS